MQYAVERRQDKGGKRSCKAECIAADNEHAKSGKRGGHHLPTVGLSRIGSGSNGWARSPPATKSLQKSVSPRRSTRPEPEAAEDRWLPA